MRCVIPSVSKVSLANIILLTLFVGSSFGLGFCFALCIARVASAVEELPTSLLITQSWRNSGVNETKIFFHGLLARSYFKGFSTSKCCSFQVFILLNVSTFFIVFYNNKHSFIFLFYKALII